jgi:hypothetical protein
VAAALATYRRAFVDGLDWVVIPRPPSDLTNRNVRGPVPITHDSAVSQID